MIKEKQKRIGDYIKCLRSNGSRHNNWGKEVLWMGKKLLHIINRGRRLAFKIQG